MVALCRTYDPLKDQLVLQEMQLPSCIQPQLNRSSALPQDPPPKDATTSVASDTATIHHLQQACNLTIEDQEEATSTMHPLREIRFSSLQASTWETTAVKRRPMSSTTNLEARWATAVLSTYSKPPPNQTRSETWHLVFQKFLLDPKTKESGQTR
ncbi:hypothetical protein BO94DRAFT_571168 [Aspergillus sclerotioniger CBS 115572]|uniref:Uncharacterized protein n=1 Tax=Aspergillus sclerotioniger CBS 115572 TaxID=1450535 RepID=A0A317XB28_9EURO|nr:hypothetical protein BO94DRAFT_571168 [Aspergillus sclerotioniger CBS 115572]PWY95595.1 hypothetical protein BO94DRAFT_571168 [Aspergillus sclerotioniger CBS 115572]